MKITIRGLLYISILIGLVMTILSVLPFSFDRYPETPDEVIYGKCARSFIEWTRTPHPFRGEVLDRYWNTEGEHPSVVKIMSGITWAVFHRGMGDLASLRMATVINFSALIIVLYIFGRLFLNRSLSLCACLFMLSIQEVIRYARLAEININLAFLWTLTALFFVKGIKNGKGWIYAAGAVAGIAAGSKIATLIIPASILIWMLLYHREKLLSVYLPFLATGALAFLLTWPTLWSNPVIELTEHIKWHAGSYMASGGTDWSSAFKALFSNVPLGLMVLFPLGIIKIVKEGKNLEVFPAMLFLTVLSVSSMPPFYPVEGIRYFLPAIPFFAVVCAMGLEFLMAPVLKKKVAYV